MSFKLSKETDDHYVMHHKDGSFLKIAKKGLSSELHSKIQSFAGGGEVKVAKKGLSPEESTNNPKIQQSKVRNYDDGGTVKDPGNPFEPGKYPMADMVWNGLTGGLFSGKRPQEVQQQPGSPGEQVISNEVQKAFAPQASEEVMTRMPNSSQMPPSQEAPIAPAQQGDQNPLQMQNLMAQKQAGLLGQEQNALSRANAAQQQYGESIQRQSQGEAEIKAHQALEQQNFMDLIDKHQQDFSDESQKQIDEFKSGKIDFNRVWNNKSDGQKAVTIMGMILGGIGSGLTGQPNAAMQVLDKMMERDIGTQKAELDKKNTLYGMFLKKYGNERDATIAHMAALNNIFNSQLEQTALQQKGPQAMAAAQMAIQERNMKMLPQLNDMFIRRAAIDQLQQQMTPQGGGKQQQATGAGIQPNANGKTLRLMKMSGMIDEKDYEEANKELKGHQENESIRSSLLKDFGRLQHMLKSGVNVDQSEIQSIFNSSAGKLTKLQSGRFNMEEAKLLMQSILPGLPVGIDLGKYGFNIPLKVLAKDSDQTQANKLERLNNLFNAESYPQLEGLGMYKRSQK